MFKLKDLSINFLGKTIENPFILSASPSTDELEMAIRGLEAGWAGVILKTTSVEENEVPLKYPMMSSFGNYYRRVLGLGNIDLISKYHIDEVEKRVKILKERFPEKMIAASIMGSKKEDWQSLVSRLKKANVDLIECSFSCPQGSMGEAPGRMLAQSVSATEKVVGWVKEAAGNTPVLIKITPQVTDIVEVARAVKKGGADGITASNTIPSLLGIDIYTFEPYPSVFGVSSYSGLSGNAIKPITLRTIAEIKRNVDIVISGNGGAYSSKDAIEIMLVGASNVQFCTLPMVYGFRVIEELKKGLSHYLDEMNFNSPSEIVGKTLEKIKSNEELPHIEVKAKIDKDKCIGCDLCYISCNDGGHMAIEIKENRIPEVNVEKCVGCALCMQVCPVDAIFMNEKMDDKERIFIKR
ncbi:MAG: NAD-dependent dihydropyrimidine dehydrogenase subunit PreA [Caldisericia bacterium]